MIIYLDCNATSPIEPRVEAEVIKYMTSEFGNSGSRTHEFGNRAKVAVERSREQVGNVVAAKKDEVVFTSGATESNNIAILGMEKYGMKTGKKHIISTQIEHKAVLEPLEVMQERGFEVTLLKPDDRGWVEAEAVKESLREDTLLVTVMQANNETGVLQPIEEIAEILVGHDAFFHVDAAQGFGKEILTLQNKRIDLISISGHKLFTPKGIGALITRRRGYDRPPLSALMYGGGQEKGLRPGTLPVHLIVGLGVSAELCMKGASKRNKVCQKFRNELLSAFEVLQPSINGDPEKTMTHVVNMSFPGLDSEAVMVALKDIVAISNGSACTSQNYALSHVLQAMGLSEDRIQGAVRISWCHMTEKPDWKEVVKRIRGLL